MKLSRRVSFTVLITWVIAGSPVFAESSEDQPGQQVEAVFESSDGAKVPYLIYLPKNYAADSDQEFALLYFFTWSWRE